MVSCREKMDGNKRTFTTITQSISFVRWQVKSQTTRIDETKTCCVPPTGCHIFYEGKNFLTRCMSINVLS